MAYLAIAYPQLAPVDFEWIQSYRARYDRRYYSVVNPHFTLVFGGTGAAVQSLSETSFAEEIEMQLADAAAIPFELAVATINRDLSGEYYHEFLVPELGYAKIVRLHDKLYSGKLKSRLRLDIDYIPHIGIGNDNDPQNCKARIDELNLTAISVRGVINTVDVIEYSNGEVRTIRKIMLPMA
jgi:2'-5' RNA ligase